MSDDRYDRNQLLRLGWGRFKSLIARTLEAQLDFVPRSHVRPPGAQVESLFVATCTGCADCLVACPHGSIRLTGEAGLQSDSTPVILPALTPCYMCEDTPCAAKCPTGSLIPPRRIDIGTAVVDEDRCRGYQGEECAECVSACPVPGAIERGPRGGPVVTSQTCTGCGICTFSCPTSPRSIRIKPK